MRASGILMGISSIPSKYGIGCFSKEAYDFVDQLEKAGQQYWQILPLGPDWVWRFSVSVCFYICRESIFY